MSRRVTLSRTSQKSIEQLGEPMRTRVVRAIYQYAMTGIGAIETFPRRSNINKKT